ncbi:hypothetical protein TNCV_1281251 [Trichonephila clavipes]|nr:hypothetical protein TNCV_1281251 [Trichonephila clavipes]
MRSIFDMEKLVFANSSWIPSVSEKDSAPCHTVKYWNDWYRSKILEFLSWPGNSPDFNPIENLRHSLKTLVRMSIGSMDRGLETTALDDWDEKETEFRPIVKGYYSRPLFCDLRKMDQLQFQPNISQKLN